MEITQLIKKLQEVENRNPKAKVILHSEIREVDYVDFSGFSTDDNNDIVLYHTIVDKAV